GGRNGGGDADRQRHAREPKRGATRGARKAPYLSPVIGSRRARPSQKRDEKAVRAALCLEAARQEAMLLLDPVIVAPLQEGAHDLLALRPLQRADRIDEPATGLQPAGNAGEHRALALGQLGDRPRADAVEDVGVAAEDAGRRA